MDMNAQMQMEQQNAIARRVVLQSGVKMKQQIFSASVNPAEINRLNIPVRPVGLVLGFIIQVEGIATNAAGTAADRTIFGTANALREITFNDLNSYTRVRVPGWYLAFLNTARSGYGYGGVYANGIPMDYTNNYDVYEGAANLAASASSDISHVYYLPVSYSSTDLRGAIYAATTGANMSLDVEINRTPFVGATNSVNAIYSGNAGGGWNGNVTVTVYQVYIDQIQRDQTGAPIVPMLDLNTAYELKQTSFNGPSANQDFPMAYSDYRSFLSTFAVFDNGGVFNNGTDVNYFSLVSANSTNIWRVTPKIAALDTRNIIMTDAPSGCYYFDSRDIPINTVNFGNMELNLNASSVNANARVLVGFESFALISQLSGASSLGGG